MALVKIILAMVLNPDMRELAGRLFHRLAVAENRADTMAIAKRVFADHKVSVTEWAELGKALGIFEVTIHERGGEGS